MDLSSMGTVEKTTVQILLRDGHRREKGHPNLLLQA